MGTFRNPGGRPSKFKKKYIGELVDFFNVEPTRKELMEETTKNGGEVSRKYKHVANRMPSIVKFAKHIDVDYTTVYRWAKHGDDSEVAKELGDKKGISSIRIKELAGMAEFSKAYKTCKRLQQDFLMDNGLVGASPASAYIFTAKNVSGMRDKVESDVRVTEVKPLLDNLRKNGVQNHNSDSESRGDDEAD